MWLGYTEEQVWSLTPRKFASQLEVHEEITRMMNGRPSGRTGTRLQTSGYIDQIPGW